MPQAGVPLLQPLVPIPSLELAPPELVPLSWLSVLAWLQLVWAKLGS